MKRLPKIYKNNIDKKINNNKEVCYLKNGVQEELSRNSGYSKNVDDVLLEIFNGIGYSYNIPVIIKTSNKIYETSLITKTRNNVVTLDNDVIPIGDISSIEIVNK